MLSITYDEYIKSYQERLLLYLSEYEDNIEDFFLENEKDIYGKYLAGLNKISNTFNGKSRPGLREDWDDMKVFDDLININSAAYDKIVSTGDEESKYGEDVSEEGEKIDVLTYWKAGLVKIDFDNLMDLITSAKRILDFIGQQLTILLSPNKNATSIYLTGHLPQDISKVQAEVPCEGKSVNNLDNVTSNVSNTIESHDSYDNMKITIEKYLENIVDDINPNDFKILVDTLYSYFTTGDFPKLENQIMFNSVNKKKVGWALKEAYKNIIGGTLKIDYFRFAKENINLFSKEKIDTTPFNKSKFYKYFTTNPAN